MRHILYIIEQVSNYAYFRSSTPMTLSANVPPVYEKGQLIFSIIFNIH